MLSARYQPLLLLMLVIPLQTLAHVGFHEEIEEITERLSADPGNAELYWLRGDVNRVYEHWDRALSDFETARRIDPQLYESDLGIGRTYYDQGLYREAISYLNRFLAHEPGNIRGLQTRARARHQLGQYQQAAADYTAAIGQFEPPAKPTPAFYLERARSQVAAGKRYVNDAVQGLEEGLKVLGPIITIELYIVELQTDSGQYDAALQRMNRIIDRSARKDAYLLRRSEILKQAGRSDEARQDLYTALNALDKLPGSRRNTRAVENMRSRIYEDLEALER